MHIYVRVHIENLKSDFNFVSVSMKTQKYLDEIERDAFSDVSSCCCVWVLPHSGTVCMHGKRNKMEPSAETQ